MLVSDTLQTAWRKLSSVWRCFLAPVSGFCLIYLAISVSTLVVWLLVLFCFALMEVFCLTVATSWSQTLKVTKLEAEVPLNELCECQVKLRL